MSGLERLGARELLAGYRSRAFSPLEVLDLLAARIERLDPALGAFTTLCLERARAEAAAASDRYARAEPCGPLDGVPLGVKDLYDSAGVATSYGSAMFAGTLPARDAEALRRARAAGAVVVGKTQTHEFAWGISSVNEAMGTARNPWQPARIAGGSSGGSAVALAAGLVPLALGTDTGGSIRIPSAFCGTVGLKPTYGRVSTAGVFPLARTLDHAGPMARDPGDAALLLSVCAGRDAGDPATAYAPAGALPAEVAASLAGVRVGLCPELRPVALAPGAEAAFEALAALVPVLGGELVEVALPEAAGATEFYAQIQRAEALDAHIRAGLYPAHAAEYGADVRALLEAASGVELGDYLAAGAARARLRAGFRRVFDRADVLLSPVAPCAPFRIGEERALHHGTERTLRELVLGFTVPQDLAGLPACALRAGFDGDGLPVGAQLTGAPWDEPGVLRAAAALYAASARVQSRWPAAAEVVP